MKSHPWLLIIQVVLILLKVTGNLTWDWAWVLAPMWGSFVILLIAVILMRLGGYRSR